MLGVEHHVIVGVLGNVLLGLFNGSVTLRTLWLIFQVGKTPLGLGDGKAAVAVRISDARNASLAQGFGCAWLPFEPCVGMRPARWHFRRCQFLHHLMVDVGTGSI